MFATRARIGAPRRDSPLIVVLSRYRRSRAALTDLTARDDETDNYRMPAAALTIGLLVASNVFMTFAWYAHLRNLSGRPWYIAAIVSWGIALFEYLLQVPANRIGFSTLTLAQLKILQEVITLSVFVPFAVLYMRQPLNLNFLWAGLCLLGAVYFMFR